MKMNFRSVVPANSELPKVDRFQLHRRWLTLARLVWILISLVAVGLLITAVGQNTMSWWNENTASCRDMDCLNSDLAHIRIFGNFHRVAIFFAISDAVETLPWVFVGALIFWRKSRDPFALFFSLGMVIWGAYFDGIVRDVIWRHFPNLWLFNILIGSLVWMVPVAWYRFPDGRFAHPNFRWLVPSWILIAVFSSALRDSALDYNSWPPPYRQLVFISFAGSIAFALIYRYRYLSGPIERQQIRWVAFTSAIFMGLLASVDWIFSLYHGLLPFVIYFLLRCISSAIAAIGIGISILRYRLWDIDIIINRTLVYGTLTASVIGIYVLVVGILGTTIQGRGNLLISILATGLVAILVQPLRDRLQRGVNRMMYGERDDPVTVLSRLGQRLEGTLAPDAVLPSLVETVAQTLKLPYVAIETVNDHRSESQPTTDSSLSEFSSPTVSYGTPQADVIRLPLIYQSETIGQLVVALRAHGEALSPMDRHLLENIAHQAGMAVHAVSLTADLQRSRQRLVTTREEERRRLRRDLHDGLGPNLASQGLKLAAVQQLLESNPSAAKPLLEQVMEQNKSTVDDVRRLVYGLRPPALDELGLVAAIRDHVAGMDGKFALQIEITEPPDGLPTLSAAVEVAAYRIILEALTNVIRHAQAKYCAIRFSVSHNGSSDILGIEIQDDGKGMPAEHRAGVGLRSMRERAEEIGGSCVVESDARQGTCVSVKVPLITM
jgi:signal transduction histidine kinase